MKKLIALSLILMLTIQSCKESAPTIENRFEKNLTVDGIARSFIVRLPSEELKSESGFPLIIAFHGFGGSGAQMEENYLLAESALPRGYAVVFPDGVAGNGILTARSWNAGNCCADAFNNQIDDLRFVQELLENVKNTFTIDDNRIYLTGMSNGGMMAYYAAREYSDQIAAVVPVSTTLFHSTTQTTNEIPLMHYHSERDVTVPYDGGVGLGGVNFPPVLEGIEYWLENNDCDTEPLIDEFDYHYEYTWSCDLAPVRLLLTKDGGHSWPGGEQPRIGADPITRAFDGNQIMLDFFDQHRK